MSHDRAEVVAAVEAYISTRDRISAGEGTWADLAPFFTDDVVYIDPAWGRLEGIEAIRAELLGEAMEGLDDWTFPTDFFMVDGDTAVVKWRQEFPGTDGKRYVQSGYSTMVYAGDGKFSYEEDLLNMAHVIEDIVASGWQPPEGQPFPMPPAGPNRDFTIP